MKLENKKIGILYIAIGKYRIFWDDFYKSCEKFFMRGFEKQYYVFSDNSLISNEYNVDVIPVKDKGWPYNSLLRFEMFLSIKEKLMDLDFLFFFNANCLIEKPILVDFIDIPENYIFALHPTFFENKNVKEYPYSRNEKSTAFIPLGEGDHYFQAAFFGGKTLPFIEMCLKINDNIQKDEGNKVMAVWHDESHLNRFAIDRNDIKVVGPEYVWAEYLTQEGQKYKDREYYILCRMKEKYFNVEVFKEGYLSIIKKDLKKNGDKLKTV